MKLYSLTQYHEALVTLVLSYLVAGVATVAVFFRCWARRMKRVDLWIDDYAAIAALFILWILVAMQTADGKLGIRTHTQDLPPENLEIMFKVLLSGQLLYSLCLLLGKSSYVFFYRRIFVTKSFKTATWVVLALICAWFVGNVLQVFLICRPLASNWDLSVAPTCGNRPVVYTVMGSVNVATDATLMILPIPYINKLQMSTSSKVGVSMTFLFGLIICAVSIARTVEVYKLDYEDPSFELLTTNFWSTVEPALLIANSCVPLLRPPLQSMFSRFWSKTRSATRSATHYAFGGTSSTTNNNNNHHHHHNSDQINKKYGSSSLSRSHSQNTHKSIKSLTGKPLSRLRLSGYAGPMGTSMRSATVREDDEIEMVPGELSYHVGKGGAAAHTVSEERTGGSSDLETGGIRVQTDWSVTEEKIMDRRV